MQRRVKKMGTLRSNAKEGKKIGNGKKNAKECKEMEERIDRKIKKMGNG